MPIVEHHRLYIGGDTKSEVFENLVGGPDKANTVHNAMTTAIARFEDIADNIRAEATELADQHDNGRPFEVQNILDHYGRLSEQFDKQAADTRALLALLRGDDEEEI